MPCVAGAEEVAKVQLELDSLKQAHSEARALITVADDKLKNYKDKICDGRCYLEGLGAASSGETIAEASCHD